MIEKERLPVAPDRAGYIPLPTRALRVERPRLFISSATERQAARRGARWEASGSDCGMLRSILEMEASHMVREPLPPKSGSEEVRHTSESAGGRDALPRNEM